MVEPGEWTGVFLDGLDTDFVGNGVNTCFEDGVSQLLVSVFHRHIPDVDCVFGAINELVLIDVDAVVLLVRHIDGIDTNVIDKLGCDLGAATRARGEGQKDYKFVLQADLYNKLSQAKVIQKAALRSGISKGSINAAWDAIGEVIKAWATEGHSVAIPGLGSMRFGLRSKSVKDINDVATKLITSRRVIFTPSSEIKQELKDTSISITCYDKYGKVIKRVTSTDDGDIEEDDKDYTISLSASPAEGGDVTGAGGYDSGDSVTIKATPKSGYKFVKWSDGNTQAERTFDATEDLTLTATFEKVQSSTGGGSTDQGSGGNGLNLGEEDYSVPLD